MGRSLTLHPDPDPDLDRGPDLGGLVVLRLVGLRLTRLVGRVALRLVVLRLVGREVTGLVGRVALRLVVLRLVGLRLTRLVGRVVLDRAVLDRAVLVGLVDRGLQDLTDRVALVGLVGPAARVDLAALVGRVGLAAGVDRHRLRTGPRVPTTGVTPKEAAPMTRRTASAHPTMARRLRPRNTGSAGMVDPLPEGLRPTGPGRRLRVAGTGRRLRVAGTLDGTGRRAT